MLKEKPALYLAPLWCFVNMATLAQAHESGGDTAAAQIETVIVTAQKRTENLQDVPMAISVLSAERIRNLGATRLSDLAAAAPAFSTQRASNVDTLFIRGEGGGGRNIGFGGRAGVYLDGVYVGQQVQAQGMLRQYAVELAYAF